MAKKKAKRAKKKGSSKSRKAAARKAAKTRAAKHAARSRAAKKAARTRARKGGSRKGRKSGRKGGHRKGSRKGSRKAREMAMEPRKSKKGRKGKKGRKSGKRRSKRMDTASALAGTRAKLATLESRYAQKFAATKARMEKAQGQELERLRAKLVKLEAERGKEIARIKNNSEKKLAALQAAERRRGRKGKKRKSRKGGRRRARRNPIGSGGGHEYLATAAGILTGIVLTVLPYRMIRSHALTAVGGGSGAADAPVQGDVPNLLTGQLPLWGRLKWKGLLALGVVAVVDIALPLTAAALIESSDGWKTYFQLWGWTGVTLGATKLTVDVLSLATKKTLIGQRMFAPENTARDVRTQSMAAQLPPIQVGPGLGMPGLTGYGRPKAGCEHVGAGAPCCDACAGATGKVRPPPSGPSVPPPITGTTPMSAQPGGTLPATGGTLPGQPGGGTPTGVIPSGPTQFANANPNGTPATAIGAQGAAPESRFAPKNRFDSKRLRSV